MKGLNGVKDSHGKVWLVNPHGHALFAMLTDHNEPDFTEICDLLRPIASTISWSSTYAGDVLWVKESDVQQIPALIECLLDKGHTVWFNDGSQLTMKPYKHYTVENYEKCLLEQYQYGKEIMKDKYTELAGLTMDSFYVLADNFTTPRLQLFLLENFPLQNANSEFRKTMQTPNQPIVILNRESEYWQGIKGYSKFESLQEKTKPEPIPMVVEDEEESGMCVVCDEFLAATFLEPCEHLYCCEVCSLRLENDANYNDKCIVCQQKIEKISYLSSGKIKIMK